MKVAPRPSLICLAIALALPLSAQAASFASSASSAGSASVGSISDSFQGSSNSSSEDDGVAAGEYRVTDVAQAARGADHVAVTMQAEQGTRHFTLTLPRAVWEGQGLAAGDRVHVATRPYGFEFARATDRDAFYLVLNDDWYGELAARPL